MDLPSSFVRHLQRNCEKRSPLNHLRLTRITPIWRGPVPFSLPQRNDWSQMVRVMRSKANQLVAYSHGSMSIVNGRPTDLGFQSLRIIGNDPRVLRTGKKAIADLLSGLIGMRFQHVGMRVHRC